MKHLYVIRHGLAGERLEDEKEDELRALTKKGIKEIKSISKSLKKLEIKFDEVLTSPLIRAFETAEFINKKCGSKDLNVTDFLKPDADFNHLVKFIDSFKDANSLAIVGHEPFLSSFASYCLSGEMKTFIQLKKGGVLLLEIDQTIKPGKSKLIWHIEPRQLTLWEKN